MSFRHLRTELLALGNVAEFERKCVACEHPAEENALWPSAL